MEVTIVDSAPSVVALIDSLDHLPTHPPSLYLDIEGVNLSRHGSISILQLFVAPTNRVFLIDVFLLQEKAFGTSNRSGTTLASILCSTQVPKVFFDVRNDADALFAHFQISMGGVHDVQLLEVATRRFSKERLTGLARCIESDAGLPPDALAAWKAVKQKGQALFAPELGGSYEVFNSRPIRQDIVDYCTHDVVYLPLLWRTYNSRKISKPWMRKVQDETSERLRVSQTPSYEPRGKNKTLSPWASPAKSGQKDRSDDAGAKVSGRKTTTTATGAQVAATEVAKRTAATQPGTAPRSQLPAEEKILRRSARLAALKATQKAPQTPELERLQSQPDLPIRSKEEPKKEPHKKTSPTVVSDMVHTKWTCVPCGRAMQEQQKEEHLAGKHHIARVKQTTARQSDTASGETPRATPITIRTGKLPKTAKPRPTNPSNAKGKGPKKQAVMMPSESQQGGLPYPPDHLFVGFADRTVPRYETAFLGLGDEDYGLCDKDCGWCGHCVDNVDF